ncbi:MAG TPA: hypothetical protein VFV28_10505 [Limnobacter sp.]|nr:hypothetical protein [Limnobacter sp.]
MLQFCNTIRHWLIALLLGVFSFQALAASASELCRFHCQKDWKANVAVSAASAGDSAVDSRGPGDPADRWSPFSTPCPDLLPAADSADPETGACTSCGMCALNAVVTLPEVDMHMDLMHSSKPVVELAQATAWLNDGLFKPPRS